MARPAVVLDGDDTLWFVEPLYDEARELAAAAIAAAGLDAARWEQLQRRIDVANVPLLGVSTERFPASCVAAYRRLADESRLPVRASVAERVRRAAETVFERAARPVPDVGDLLASLRGRFVLALLTKGERAVQRKRIADAGLAEAFDHISIVPAKGEGEFRASLRAVGAAPATAWSVGNSLASDINPALRIGMRGIWIDAHVWEYERRERAAAAGHLVVAADLASAVRLLLGPDAGAPLDDTPAPRGRSRRHGPA